MAQKPAQLCVLQKEKLIDTQKGFVDTFNWVTSFCANLKGEPAKPADAKNEARQGIEVDTTVSDHPVVKLTGDAPKGGGAATLTIVGNGSTDEVVCRTGKITFAADANSNVVITPTADAEGNVTITIGVYYK